MALLPLAALSLGGSGS
ncbi:hypothetical protein E2C01_074161 [Portunus trituberculatus]|uniref:Uncharacterized protein n=1 Tax=Portunus trituberculatus TaxID=210409 RepID=A0A5B7IBP2_PORTR|nr:hypothetical protein [Portunus trituberculatus]